MTVRFLVACAFVVRATSALAQGAAQRPSPQPSQNQQPTDDVRYEEQVVVSASRVGAAAGQRAGRRQRRHPQTIQNSPAANIGDLLRAVPGVNVTQVSARDMNITTRGATSHAVDVAAGAGRRPQHLSRFLRHGDVGPGADQSERHPADRSDSRAGVRRLGRQCDDRRRQRDHQDAARAARPSGATTRDDRRRQLRPQRRRAAIRAPARCSTSTARTRRRSNDAGRTRCRPATSRRTRCRVRPATFPTRSTRRIPPSRTRARRSRSSTRASTTTSRAAARLVVRRRRRRHRRHHPHRHRPVRHRAAGRG